MKLAENEQLLKDKCANFADLGVAAAMKVISDQTPKKTCRILKEDEKTRPTFQTSTTVWKLEGNKGEEKRWKKHFPDDGRRGNRAGARTDQWGTIFSGTYSRFFFTLARDILSRWGPEQPGKVLDPFCGGPVRGAAATLQGHEYHGFDVRKEAIQENQEFSKDNRLEAHYHHGDARTLRDGPAKFDFAYTSPPYFNLETYSDQKDDLSSFKTYDDFNEAMKKVARTMTRKMKSNSFVCIVVGNFRDQKGQMIDFRGDTVRNFQDAGFQFWQDVILHKPNGSAPVRASSAWKGKKLVRVHEYLLVLRTPPMSRARLRA